MPLSDIDYEAPSEETSDDPAEIQPASGEVLPPSQESAPVKEGVAWDDDTKPDEDPVQPSAPEIPATPKHSRQSNIIHRFHTRLETARGRIATQAGNDEQWAGLVEQAITLLDAVSQHPALSNYSAHKRKLDDVEQRLGYGAYPQ